MRWLIILPLMVTACAGKKSVVEEQRTEIVRCDTIGAHFADEFHIQLRDVVVFPSDSTFARVRIEEVNLKGKKRADVIAESKQTVSDDTHKSSTTDEPSRRPSKFILYLVILLLLYLLIVRK